MEKDEILKLYNELLSNYDPERTNQIWSQKSKEFRDFWAGKIMNAVVKEINDEEIDQIVRILDRSAKGNRKGDEAVARVMVPQGAWRRMFNEIKSNEKLKTIMNNLFNETDDAKATQLINDLYKANEGKKNNLTGKAALAIDAMLFTYSPLTHVSVVSLNDRKLVIDYFGLSGGPNFDTDSQGEKVVLSNKAIVDGFKEKYDINPTPRVLSAFLYRTLQPYWKPDTDVEIGGEREVVPTTEVLHEEVQKDKALFYMESQLEDFLIENWDKTDFGKNYELITDENRELVSQQYPTDVGRIDILVKEKKTGEYVVIELKKDQTSDDTVGQLTRYMGWVQENLSHGKAPKGIIIAASPDKRLYYALKMVNGAKLYLYEVNFTLKESEEKFA